MRVRVRDNQGERIAVLPVDDYVAGTVRAELAPATLRDATLSRVLDIQAIVSRTYTLTHLDRHQAEGFDLCDSTHCQLYRGAPPAAAPAVDAAAAAAARTRGQVITHDGRAIQAVFHADCGGHTAAAESVWSGSAVPYLRPVPDWFCSRATNSRWVFDVDEGRLRAALNAAPGSAIGPRLDRIDITARDAAGRAVQVTVVGSQSAQLRAEDFRAALLRAFGPRSLLSTWFSVVRRQDTFHFTGLGNGHGVGLCQAGAALRAKAGQLPAEVLSHYFPGTRIESVSMLVDVLGNPAAARPPQ